MTTGVNCNDEGSNCYDEGSNCNDEGQVGSTRCSQSGLSESVLRAVNIYI